MKKEPIILRWVFDAGLITGLAEFVILIKINGALAHWGYRENMTLSTKHTRSSYETTLVLL
jgi:hypothetical protein